MRAYAEGLWIEPVVVVSLGDVSPEFAVPGRRKDGTITGTRLIRRFFWNLLRGTTGTIASIALTLGGGELVNAFARNGRVSGPRDALALPLVDAARSATTPWLVHSPSHTAIIDAGPHHPELRWQATKPEAPRLIPTQRRLAWSDGSEYSYYLSAEEAAHQLRSRRL
ncbi:hypothetical protein [Actinokineospora globicatena]|uniref:hypothetical protein n=1 Tax=Actinokineospora globicatena TaxID=103729 RepID=UPI002555A24F|nr:hypothetical protein [Actinokineospora globicatena]